jgi:hypothetical protein
MVLRAESGAFCRPNQHVALAELRRTAVRCNWLSPKAAPHEAGLKGMGSFAAEPIAAGETIAAFGGYVVSPEQLAELSEDVQSRSIQIDEALFLAPNVEPEPGDFVNHSCEPNCGIRGSIMVVAMRDIAVGEEITFDYAMCDSSPYDEFVCECGEPTCRRLITGGDWLLPELQQKYDGWFSSYLAVRIAGLPVGD